MAAVEELIKAVKAGAEDEVRRLIAGEPELAGAVVPPGVSVILLAKYHRQDSIADLLAATRGELDLFEAAALGRPERVIELLAGGADVESRSGDGFSPLLYACYFGQEAVVRELISRGADVDGEAGNGSGLRPLHSAVAGGTGAIVEMLLERGARPDEAQQGGWTPLQAAAKHGNLGMVESLLAHGADPRQESDDGLTALEMAREGGHAEVVSRLEQKIE